jgi:hypothetical protein
MTFSLFPCDIYDHDIDFHTASHARPPFIIIVFVNSLHALNSSIPCTHITQASVSYRTQHVNEFAFELEARATKVKIVKITDMLHCPGKV